MPSSSAPSAFARVAALPASLGENFTPSDPIRVVEVSHKYLPPGPPNVSEPLSSLSSGDLCGVRRPRAKAGPGAEGFLGGAVRFERLGGVEKGAGLRVKQRGMGGMSESGRSPVRTPEPSLSRTHGRRSRSSAVETADERGSTADSQVENITGLPEFTTPGGPNAYVMKDGESARRARWREGA